MRRNLIFALSAYALAGCFGPFEISPRHVDPMSRDTIHPDGNFSGVHLHGVPPDWHYLTEHGAGPGDMAAVASRRYDAIFWLSTNPLHDDPAVGVAEIRRMRTKSYLRGEWLMGQEVLSDKASITYSVDRRMDGQLVEIQRTAYRRLTGPYDGCVTMTLHGRWPEAHHEIVSLVFDGIVDRATLE